MTIAFEELAAGLTLEGAAAGELPVEPGLYQANVLLPAPWNPENDLSVHVQVYLVLHPDEGWFYLRHDKMRRLNPAHIVAETVRASDWSKDPATHGGFTVEQ